MTKRTKTIIILTVISLIIMGIAFVILNTFKGNPISKSLAIKATKEIAKNEYSEYDLKITHVSYIMKNYYYAVNVKSEKSIDTHFTIYIDKHGKVIEDTYKESVLSKQNTKNRILEAYDVKVQKVLSSKELNDIMKYAKISYGEIVIDADVNEKSNFKSLTKDNLEIDKKYDLNDLGKEYGRIVLYVDMKNYDEDTLEKYLKKINSAFNKEDVAFATITLVIESNNDKDKNEEPIYVIDFPKSKITENNLTELIKNHQSLY